jgi:hypothetical protein
MDAREHFHADPHPERRARCDAFVTAGSAFSDCNQTQGADPVWTPSKHIRDQSGTRLNRHPQSGLSPKCPNLEHEVSTSEDSGGQHDNNGSGLEGHPGQSQGRPENSADSWSISTAACPSGGVPIQPLVRSKNLTPGRDPTFIHENSLGTATSEISLPRPERSREWLEELLLECRRCHQVVERRSPVQQHCLDCRKALKRLRSQEALARSRRGANAV